MGGLITVVTSNAKRELPRVRAVFHLPQPMQEPCNIHSHSFQAQSIGSLPASRSQRQGQTLRVHWLQQGSHGSLEESFQNSLQR